MRTYGETFKRWQACLIWAKTGKTFIYQHPDFVAIDSKTWDKIQAELRPPIKQQVIYDEFDEWTPEKQEILDKYFSKRLMRGRSR